MVSDAIPFLLPSLISFGIYHDTLQLCRTGHDNVSHTGMTSLACILSVIIFPLIILPALLSIFNTVRIIFMKLHSSIDEG